MITSSSDIDLFPVCLTRIVRAGDAEEEHRVPLDMPEESNPQPAPFMCTFYDAGNVGHRERLSAAIGNDPQLGDQCGERVVGNLGPCGGNGGQERGFAGVRQSYQSDIGQYLQFEYEPALLCGLPEGEFPWRPVGRRLEVVISEASLPSLTEDPLFPFRVFLLPFLPSSALMFLVYFRWMSVHRRESERMMTSPPRPPSPPSGPPFGLYFARRRWAEPLPPAPEAQNMHIWSIKLLFMAILHF